MATAKNNRQLAYQILDKAHGDFASAPIDSAFNWAEFANETDLDEWYHVAFRSTRKANADLDMLDELEELAYLDAAEQPGFLFYFKGKVPPGADHLRNLSFCMWETREFALAAAARTDHAKASAVAADTYDEYKLERYDARVHRELGKAWVEFVPLA